MAYASYLCVNIYGSLTLFQISEDFLPIISRIKATTAPLGGPKGEVVYAREHEAVWFKGKRFAPVAWAGTPGEEQIKQLRPAIDSKGRKVGLEWFTTVKVEDALTRCDFFFCQGHKSCVDDPLIQNAQTFLVVEIKTIFKR